MRPEGAGAVMAGRAPLVIEGDDERTALFRKLEFFPTPPWAARAGAALIQSLDPGDWWAWDPACGEGHMAHGLGEEFGRVFATDIHAHEGGFQHGEPLDFLSDAADVFTEADWVVTNPPFGPAAAFVEMGLRRAKRGVAILARSTWYETIGRYPLFFGGETPLTVHAPFFERVPMVLGRWDPSASSATAYSWFLFMKDHVLPEPVRALRQAIPAANIGMAIPPGAKLRFSRPGDIRRFARPSQAPLFENLEGEAGC